MTGVSAKRTAFRPPPASCSLSTGMLETATRSLGTRRVTWKLAFLAGSSQQGKARRASVGSNWVVARWRAAPSASVYRLR